ncbi:hypothetical protein PHYBLDRAFT_165961 [Phycomyces blakesleeanus NRRL 1555(-)]|uniref:Homeodomain-like DNA binding domain-containing transcription factor n=1 Tax=Phycomyces blakesleeanus (strain ATCC 8743b / DSM 1359 / FGSC 10004 / NBRC 33097 / NRRL 1555) TaxID=763407 RepID=A0A162PU29_PHYB8|nr:hypothetical protein PHYBLDRAFT_175949 [Phycomyces blakesleeanus NRRL 1555(-)]XP_018294027.1 hypothetical protein PHYBLDRAFT_165961 [Phycomyces blakesleeanus NRRL 1555(-)]OAD65561.1 hypothetical protein PHYBLDRAFT_175949 [Phycomyces blakesleeanus NRRL 1555(-)]OAD75987.1 hypothetical protein PHYBLDRAFT_165961 [Phycomyces blakesleeanus NRRL 1555(-)]|eukprot:XP_018283601.1 hypothetical protein PHYBLDRAFT_175949 [Phycomyces blakesleeanus NRRL 1555(-)]
MEKRNKAWVDFYKQASLLKKFLRGRIEDLRLETKIRENLYRFCLLRKDFVSKFDQVPKLNYYCYLYYFGLENYMTGISPNEVLTSKKMTKCIPTAPRRPNLRINAVLNSTNAGVVVPIDTPTPEVAVDIASEVQVAVTPMDHVLTLLAANNVLMQSLQQNAKGVTDAITHLKNGLDLSNKTNEFLKNSAMTSQNSVMPSAVPADSSSSMDDDLDLGAKHHPLISQLINSYIKKPNFVSTDPLKVAENNNRSAWSMTGMYGNKYNKTLALALFKYLRPQRCCTNVSKSIIINIIKNHYQNQVRVFRTSAEKIMARNKAGRRHNRKKTLLDHCIITYQTYTEAIHEGMNRYDCRNILSIEMMSEGKSDGDNKVWAYRPSWRTDELQTFISIIDELTVIHLKKNSESLKKRIPYEKEVSIPENLAVTLPDWCFSK